MISPNCDGCAARGCAGGTPSRCIARTVSSGDLGRFNEDDPCPPRIPCGTMCLGTREKCKGQTPQGLLTVKMIRVCNQYRIGGLKSNGIPVASATQPLRSNALSQKWNPTMPSSALASGDILAYLIAVLSIPVTPRSTSRQRTRRIVGFGVAEIAKARKGPSGRHKDSCGRKKADAVYSVPESAAQRIHTRLLNGAWG